MTPQQKPGFFANLKYDLSASIVVFLVALPLCLGIALASGAPLFAGIIAGMVGGIIVSLLSGSPLGVSGPAAGLVVIVLSAIQDLGAFDIFLLAVVVAGAIQIALGYIKAGVIGYYFPSSVIKGMLTGIGVIIILKQIPHAVGYDKDPEGDFAFFQQDGHNTLSEFMYMIDFINPGAVAIALLSIIILILWERPFMKKQTFTRFLPGPLVAVLSGIGLNIFFRGIPSMALEENQVVKIPVPETFMGFFDQFTFPNFTAWNNPDVLVVGVTIAVVASLETLLCVEATDKQDPLKRVTPTNRELTAQGVGNMISGLIGGLPITQVIVRSSANMQSGGKTKASAFFHGILLLVSAMTIPQWLNLIPLSSLAAILFLVGYKLAKPSLIRSMYNAGREQFIPFAVTVLGIVFTDLLMGIGMGLVVAFFHILWKNYRTPYHFDLNNYDTHRSLTIHLGEHMTFLHKAGLLRTLNQIPDDTHVVIDAVKTTTIDADVLEIIQDFEQGAHARDIEVEFQGLEDKLHPHDEAQFAETIKEQPKVSKRITSSDESEG